MPTFRIYLTGKEDGEIDIAGDSIEVSADHQRIQVVRQGKVVAWFRVGVSGGWEEVDDETTE